jgi:DNA/RNA endonuclease YhcR with UshA esterase domain
MMAGYNVAMKFISIMLLAVTIVPTIADTYTGVVTGVKHFHNGGVVVDLDDKYPNEKMQLYVQPADVSVVGALPSEGAKVTATGAITQYHGKPEIKIHQASQWKW